MENAPVRISAKAHPSPENIRRSSKLCDAIATLSVLLSNMIGAEVLTTLIMGIFIPSSGTLLHQTVAIMSRS
jgi:hypothetical protein